MWDEEEREIVRPTPEEAASIPKVKYEYLDHPADVQIHAWGDNLREAFEQVAMGMYGYMTDPETVEITEVREVEAEAEDVQGLLFHFLDECLFVFSCEPFFIARKVVITEWEAGGDREEGKEGGTVGEKEKDGEVGKATGGGGGGDEKGGIDREQEGGVSNGSSGGGGGGTGSEATDEREGGGGGGGTGGEATEGREGGGGGMFKIRAKLFGEEFQLGKHPQGTEVKAITYASMQVYDRPGQHEVFVIIDI